MTDIFQMEEKNLIQRCLNNLIDNALKYGDKVNIELIKKIQIFLSKLKTMDQEYQKKNMIMYSSHSIKLTKEEQMQNRVLV